MVTPRSKAVSFQVLGIGNGSFIVLVLFENGAVKQIVPEMIEEPKGGTN